jgi:hypothetical protein
MIPGPARREKTFTVGDPATATRDLRYEYGFGDG